MPRITYISHEGEVKILEGRSGESVMRTAVRNGVRGIVGECGGVLSCATCHVFVDLGCLDRLPPPGDMEDELLEGTAVDRGVNSRLSCQIIATDETGDIAVTLPEYQE